jgi:hypothetical protein
LILNTPIYLPSLSNQLISPIFLSKRKIDIKSQINLQEKKYASLQSLPNLTVKQQLHLISLNTFKEYLYMTCLEKKKLRRSRKLKIKKKNNTNFKIRIKTEKILKKNIFYVFLFKICKFFTKTRRRKKFIKHIQAQKLSIKNRFLFFFFIIFNFPFF